MLTIVIDEFNLTYSADLGQRSEVIFRGDRNYTIISNYLTINFKAVGTIGVIKINIAEVLVPWYRATEYNIVFKIGKLAVSVLVTNFDLEGCELSLTLDTIDGAQVEIPCYKVLKEDRILVYGLSRWVIKLCKDNAINELLKIGNWVEVPVIKSIDYVLFDTGRDFYLRVGVKQFQRDVIGSEMIGYMLKEGTMLCTVGLIDKGIFSYGFARNDLGLGLSSVVSKRLL